MERSYGDLQDKNRIISDQKVTQCLLKSFRYVCFLESCLKSISYSWEQFSSGERVSVHKLEQFCVASLCSCVSDPENVENPFH